MVKCSNGNTIFNNGNEISVDEFISNAFLEREVWGDLFIEYDIKNFQAMNLSMASDGFHPSKEVYAIWGRQVAALVRQSFNS